MKKKRILGALLVFSAFALTTGSALTSCETTPPTSSNETSKQETHSISVVSTTDAKVSTDKTSAKAGETVTVSISQVVEGKEFANISINDGKVQTTAVKEGVTYTFVMPDEDVSVAVTFKDKVYSAHSLSVNQIEGFTVEFYKDDAKVASAVYRDEIEVRVTTTSTTQRVKNLVSDDVKLTQSKTDPDIYTFVMPDQDVSLTLTVENIPSHTLTAKLGEGATGKFFVSGKEVTTALEGQTVVFALEIDEDHSFTSINWSGVQAATTEQASYQFVMGTSDVTVTVITAEIPSFNITVAPVTGGSVEVLVDGVKGDKAKEGKAITLNITLEPHYLFKDIKVNDGEVKLTAVTEGKQYIFEMPAKAVTVTLTTEYSAQSYSITSIQTIEKGCEVLNDVKVGNEYAEGEDVVLRIKEGSTYKFSSYELLVNGTSYAFESTASSSEYEVTFKMPSADAELIIAPVSDPVEDGLTLTSIEYDDSLVDFYGLKVDQKYKLQDLYFYVIPKAGTKIKDIYYYLDESTTKRFASPSYNTPNLYYLYNYSITDETSFRIEIDAEYVGVKTVTLVNDEHLTLEGLKDSYTPGDDVEFTVTADEGWYYVDCTVETETGDNVYTSGYGDEVEFTMPEENVIITFIVGQPKKINVTPNEFIASYSITDDDDWSGEEITELAPGHTAKIEAEPVEGYEITNIYYQEGKACYEGWSGWTFDYPEEGEINIVFEVAQRRKVTYEESEAYTITGLDDDYLPGDEVEFTVHNSLGYKITDVSLDDETIDLTPNQYSHQKYSFIMPDKDVAIKVTTESVTTHSLTFTKPEGIGTVNISNAYGERINSGDKVNAGEELTIGLGSVNNGFTLNSISLVTASGTTTLTEGTGGEYQFTMPAEDAEIVLDLTEEEKHPITLNSTDDRISMTIREGDSSWGDTYEQGYVGHRMNVEIKLNDPNEIEYLDGSQFKVQTASGTDVELLNDITTFKSTTLNIKFIMPAEEVIITPVTAKYPTYTPTFVGEVEQYITFRNGYGSNAPIVDLNNGVKAGTTIVAWLNDNAQTDTNKYTITGYTMENDVKKYFREEYSFHYTGDYISLSIPDSNFYIELIITPKA